MVYWVIGVWYLTFQPLVTLNGGYGYALPAMVLLAGTRGDWPRLLGWLCLIIGLRWFAPITVLPFLALLILTAIGYVVFQRWVDAHNRLTRLIGLGLLLGGVVIAAQAAVFDWNWREILGSVVITLPFLAAGVLPRRLEAQS